MNEGINMCEGERIMMANHRIKPNQISKTTSKTDGCTCNKCSLYIRTTSGIPHHITFLEIEILVVYNAWMKSFWHDIFGKEWLFS